MKLRSIFGVASLVALGLACSDSSSSVQNPTGTCKATGLGNRAGYDGDPTPAVWLPDCKNTLAREYWRVFAQSAQSAYVLPRPDADPNLVAVCDNASHPLHALAESYFLCSPGTPDTLSRINGMLPADALALTHYLHTTLAFVIDNSQSGTGISPFPIPSDIIDACALHPGANSADFEAICVRERDRLQSGILIGYTYEGPGAVELVARLNELYGIACSTNGTIPVSVCTCGPAGGCQELSQVCRTPCQTNSDCPDPALPTCAWGICNTPCI
jgi:hypothetical protein